MDDFFRIPKSLCYFMMRHPPVERKVPSDLVTRRNENDDQTREEEDEESKKIPLSPSAQKSEDIPTIKIECPPAEEIITAESVPPPPMKRQRRINQKPQKSNKKRRSPGKSKTNLNLKSECPPEDIPIGELIDVPSSAREQVSSRAKKPKKKSEPVTYECEACSMSFSIRRNYRLHMIKHSTVRSHKCKICDKAFKRKSELNTHMQLHSGVKYTCDECDFVTTTKISVRIHVRRVHQRDFRYKCDECGKSFMSNCELKDHRTSHLGEKSFICEFCGKAYLQKSYLVAHKRVVHGVIQKSIKKDHQCKICNKSFASEYILKNHGGVHTRKFLCTRCGKEFATNHGLLLHNRMHTGERPYQCTQCSKSFVRSNALAVHKLTHSGERPYVCDLCGKSFTQRTTMMVHRKKHPGSHPPPPPTILKRLVNTVDSHS